jgi:predicted aspartyl protease
MITGVVTANREATIRLLVHGPARRSRKIKAVIDTGFDGWLSLPPALIVLLGLPWRRRGRALLADGSENLFDIYEGTVVWDRHRRRIPIDPSFSRKGFPCRPSLLPGRPRQVPARGRTRSTAGAGVPSRPSGLGVLRGR